MTVQIVTDNGGDIPYDIQKKLNIKVVPFEIQQRENNGNLQSFPDINFDVNKLYDLLKKGGELKTSAPSPGEFLKIYKEHKEVVSILVSKELSGTYGSALLAATMIDNAKNHRIEVIDSRAVVMGQGLLVILAAKMALEGRSIDEITKVVNNLIPRIHLLGVLDTLKHILDGGRLIKNSLAVALLRKVDKEKNLKFLLTLKDGKIGHVLPKALVNTKNIEKRLVDFVTSFGAIEAVAVEYTTESDYIRAEKILTKIKEKMPAVVCYISRIGPALGVHGGPGTIIVSVLEKREVKEEEKEYSAGKLLFARR